MSFFVNLYLPGLIFVYTLQFFLFIHKMIIVLLINLILLSLELVSYFYSIIKFIFFSFSLSLLLISFLLSQAKFLLHLFPLLLHILFFSLVLVGQCLLSVINHCWLLLKLSAFLLLKPSFFFLYKILVFDSQFVLDLIIFEFVFPELLSHKFVVSHCLLQLSLFLLQCAILQVKFV